MEYERRIKYVLLWIIIFLEGTVCMEDFLYTNMYILCTYIHITGSVHCTLVAYNSLFFFFLPQEITQLGIDTEAK